MIKSWFYQTIGSSNNPAVVFLHGFLGAGCDWKFVGDALAEDYFCIFPDLPGHGQNGQALPTRSLTLRMLAAELARTLASLRLADAHLVGYSMGGRVGLTFAVYYPGQARSLILESASPGLEGRQARRQRRQLDDARAAAIREDGLARFVDDWYEMALFASLKARPGLVEQLKNERKQNNPQAMARIVAELSPGRQPALWRRLGLIRSPALLLAGELDPQYTAMVQKMATAMPGARLQIMAGVGHNLHLENPVAYTRTIKTFLDSIARPA
jgi:2-succinyl-6-hydroxy-2,4-cyclohexadiene-1-carboxylate synthase